MPAAGSSSNSSAGCCISNMPISSRCFCPCDNSPASRVLRASSQSTPASLQSALARSGPVAHATTPAIPCRSSSRARGSPTPDDVSNTVGFWNLRPMPVRAIDRLRFMRVRSIVCPRKTLPESGRVLPVMTSIIVVLPAPFGPITQRNSPDIDRQRQLVQRAKSIEAHGHVFEIQNRAVRDIDLARRQHVAQARDAVHDRSLTLPVIGGRSTINAL